MPRIAILHPDLGLGGAERLIVDVALALKASGHDVDLYTNFHDKGRCFDETRNGQLNVVTACSWFPRHVFGRFHAICAYVRFVLLAIYVVYMRTTKPYDLFVCDQISACIPVLRQSGRPVLFYGHFPDQCLTKRESLAKKIYRWPIDAFEIYTTCLADRILVNSAFTRSVFERYIQSQISVHILYPTIPDQSVSSSSTRTGSLINFLSINRFERKKNLALALHSFARLRALLPSDATATHLHIIGGYDERLRENVEYYDELQQLAKQLELPPSSVTFVRSFSDADKRDYLSRAHCILYTPEGEHFGIVPLEAMQAGRPVIATATGGPLETIVDGKTGFLCEEPWVESFAKRMKEFVDDESLSRRMGDEGQRHVQQNFSFQPFARKLDEHVRQLLNSPRRPSASSAFALLAVAFCLIFSLVIYWLFF